ncbi:DUF6338 family protein [Brevundimonas sp. TWP2-3-4b1]|uniref:DUF6338 family protein n=1 Tax=Brevundimonas sp. TWP2-3-4b1 TaxID=2804580 RepID=UPI003CE8925F
MDPTKIIEVTPAEFAAIVALFLPGFVSLRVDRLIHPQRDGGTGQNMIEILGYSLLNAGLLSWAILQASKTLSASPPDYGLLALYALLICLIGPIVWPVGFRLAQRWAARRGWIVGPYRTAWDDFFSRRQPAWIVIHMTDGSLLGGYFGKDSTASMGSDAGHLYLEELWQLDQDGKFLKVVPESQGAIFRPTDYLWVEFRRDD